MKTLLQSSRRFLSLAVPVALLAACNGPDSNAQLTKSRAALLVSGGGVTVDVLATSQWQGGFNGAVRITNVSFPSPITTFEVVFNLAGNAGVGSAWNGDISMPDASGNRKATQPSWLQYQPINPGQVWDVGFNGTGSFTSSAIVSVKINGQPINLGNGYTLAVSKAGTGSGTVSSGTGEINCGSTCSATYSPGTVVTLSAQATSPSTFGGWGGACSGSGATCTITMSQAQSVTATFNGTPAYTLAVSKAGTGGGTVTSSTGGINCGATCSAAFASGTTVILTAAAAAGSTFTSWGGACSGTGATCTATMTAPLAVTATFAGNNPSQGYRVNAGGRITKNGQVIPIHCGSWFGLQGRYEIASDPQNPRGAPMEQYVGNTFWATDHTRTVMQTMNEIKKAGITLIRLPVVHQTLDATDPQGTSYLKNHSSIINDPTYPMTNSRQGLESMIKAAAAAGIYLLLDIHSCSNYVDWRKGRLDAHPPWVDATRNNYDYKREDCSCGATNNPPTVTRIQAYDETLWLQDLKVLAGLPKQLGVDNILGIDIYNEPWDYSWPEWKTLIEHAYAAVDSVNPDLTIWVQGISNSHGNQTGVGATPQPTPHGTINPNWGENLFEAGNSPPLIPKDRLVFSPHTYGPSVAVQPMFTDPAQTACVGLEGDAVAAAKCNLVINPTLLKQGWEEHFGYLKQLGYAVIVGEWGGNLDWPKGKASVRDQTMWSYLPTQTPAVDEQWQNAFTDYMVSKGIESCYWSINPESGDTLGWYDTPYDPVSNTSGWGTWGAFDTRRSALLQKVWTGIP